MVNGMNTIDLVKNMIMMNSTFILEAGAGSGKTFTLIQTLEFLNTVEMKRGQKILCITYTNVAKDEIISRLNAISVKNEYVILTMHDFFWSLISSFQSELQEEVRKLASKRIEKLEAEITEAKRKIEKPRANTNIEKQEQIILSNTMRLEKYENVDYTKLDIKYDKYTALYRGVISHDEVIDIVIELMDKDFFIKLLLNTYPYIMIDEYQDSNYVLISKLIRQRKKLGLSSSSSVGLFGDRMQQIYNEDLDLDSDLFDEIIERTENFRSTEKIIESNNILRGDSLQQSGKCQKKPIEFNNLRFIYNASNDRNLINYLDTEYEDYKRLYLVNKTIAIEIGFERLSELFQIKYNRYANEKMLKLDDALLNFVFTEVLGIYQNYFDRKISEIIKLLKIKTINELKEAESKIDNLFSNNSLSLSEFIVEFSSIFLFNQKKFSEIKDSYDDDLFVDGLLSITINEFINLKKQIDGETNLSTMHGVKGLEFNNVCVNILEKREWKNYDFISLFSTDDRNGSPIIRSHRILYVACTRAKSGLLINFICDEYSSEMEERLKHRVSTLFGKEMQFVTLK